MRQRLRILVQISAFILVGIQSIVAQELQVNWVPSFVPDRPGEIFLNGPTPLGDGRYRITLEAEQPTQYDLSVPYEVVSGFDSAEPVRATLTFPNQPSLPAELLSEGFLGVLGPITVLPNVAVDFSLTVEQPTVPTSLSYTSDRQYIAPSGPHPIRFFADVFADGSYELSGGSNTFEFNAVPQVDIVMKGYATAGGRERHFQTTFDVINRPPTIDHVAVDISDSAQRELILFVDAADADKDSLRYRVRWGDGREDFFVEPALIHAYENDGPFEIEVSVFDYLDASDTIIVPFSFPALTNQAPMIEAVAVLSESGFDKSFVINASDPEASALTYRVDWGDGSAQETSGAPLFSHRFPNQRPAQYSVAFWAVDGNGNETRYPYEVNFGPAQLNSVPEIYGIHLIERAEGRVVVAVDGADPDGEDITWSLDWGDGQSTSAQRSRFFQHEYAVFQDRNYGITVSATDPSGLTASANFTVVFEPNSNQAPQQPRMTEIVRDGFTWVGQFSAQDPDGDVVVFAVDFGDGTLPELSPNGLVRHEFPDGQYQSYTVTVTATDGRGAQASRIHVIDFPAPDVNRAPRVNSIAELFRDERTVVFKVEAVDPDGDPISVDFDWGDGFVSVAQTTMIASHTFGDSLDVYEVRVAAVDAHGARSELTHEVIFEPPTVNQPPVFIDTRELSRTGAEILFLAQAVDPEGAQLRYRWRFSDGTPDVQTETALLTHQFPEGEAGTYTVDVRATDERGAFVDTVFDVVISPPPPNLLPVILSTYIIYTSEYDVMVLIDAFDPEDDELTFIFDWGDGSLPFETNAPFAAYRYPEGVYRDYPLSVIATDGFQQSSAYFGTISIVHPPNNRPPEVEDIEILVSPRGTVDLRVDANDPDGDRFQIFVDWGDGESTDEQPILRSGVGRHRYGYRVDRTPYTGRLRLVDELGATIESEFTVSIEDSATEVIQTELTNLGDGLVHVSVVASDLDSPSQLLHSFDFDGDFVFERPSRLSGNAFHRFEQPGRHQVNVLLTDPWSGSTVVRSMTIDLPAWDRLPRVPTFERVFWTAGSGGSGQLVIEIDDPDDVVNELEVDWGDRELDGNVERLATNVASHVYAFSDEPYLGQVIARTADGTEYSQLFEVRLVDHSTEIEHFSAYDLGQGNVFISASAIDRDSPQGLPYVLDVGADGSEDRLGFGAIGEVVTFDEPGEQVCRLRVQDTWSGLWFERDLTFFVAPWIGELAPPRIGSIQLDVGEGGRVELRYGIDGEPEQLDISVHWGDENDPEATAPVGSEYAMHRYLQPRFGRSFHGYLHVEDRNGLSSRKAFTVDIVDQPTELIEIRTTYQDTESVQLEIVAQDADSSELVYAFDVRDDGQFEVEASRNPVVFFSRRPLEAVPVRILVTDPWSEMVISELYVVTDEAQVENSPPAILSLSAETSYGGHVRLSVGAEDANNDRLTALVNWGDGTSTTIAGQRLPQVNHRYETVGGPYVIHVEVSDQLGAQVHQETLVTINDTAPENFELTVTPLGQGVMNFAAFAHDPDDLILYAFDIEGDGLIERASSPIPTWTFGFASSGEKVVDVLVLDAWSGRVTTFVQRFTVPEWSLDISETRDHIVLGEGTCLELSFRDGSLVRDQQNPLECGTTESDGSFAWDMGDGTTLQGTSIAHRYVNDGFFRIRVSGVDDFGTPVETSIGVSVQNEAPQFRSSFHPLATAGEVYRSSVLVADPGMSDEIELLMEQAPTDMEISNRGDGTWELHWPVPLQSTGRHDVVLVARDGHSVENVFHLDGGETRFQFSIEVQPLPVVVPEPDPENLPSGTLSGGGSGCVVVDMAPFPSLGLLSLLLVGLITRRFRSRSLNSTGVR